MNVKLLKNFFLEFLFLGNYQLVSKMCTIGLLLNKECHKTWHTKSKELFGFKSLEHAEEILWRANLRNSNIDDTATICSHHLHVFDKYYSAKYATCCNSFGSHKKKVKGTHTITLAMAKKLEFQCVTVIPGQRFCRNCFGKAQGLDEENSSIASLSSHSEAELEYQHEIVHHEKRKKLDASIEAIEISPITTRNLLPRQKVTAAKWKLAKVVTNLEDAFADSYGVETSKILLVESAKKNEDYDVTARNSKDFELLMNELQVKSRSLSKDKLVQLLTLKPQSWSIAKTTSFFSVTPHFVETAVKVKNETGILSMPQKKKREGLSQSVIDKVVAFYESQENGRILPGKKDYISVSKNVHKQIHLLHCNLKEFHQQFCSEFDEISISFSKFASLRPKWCVTTQHRSAHAVCVCAIHQNALLLAKAVADDNTYKELMSLIVCNTDSKLCMIHRCPSCPGVDTLKSYLFRLYENHDSETMITYQQWETKEHATLLTHAATVDDFVEKVAHAMDALTVHSFIAKCQNQFLKDRKSNLPDGHLIILADFAENYQFTIQDEIQSYHWNSGQCTIHPVVIYQNSQDKLISESMCFISDDLQHDIGFVYQLQTQLTSYIKRNYPYSTKLEYYSDGCAGQYKNFKNIQNLCNHNDDFDLDADWSFFATSHGKSPCDGIGGTVKRLLTRASLQRKPEEPPINSAELVHVYCKNNIHGITFQFIDKHVLAATRTKLSARFASGKTIKGTRSYHYFAPLSSVKVGYKRTSSDNEFTGSFSFETNSLITQQSFKIMDYVSCMYDGFWWVGLIVEIEEQDALVQFLHPHGPSSSFYWPDHDDSCWVPKESLLCKLTTLKTATGRNYSISQTELTQVEASTNKKSNNRTS